jgi:hypothetical protein
MRVGHDGKTKRAICSRLQLDLAWGDSAGHGAECGILEGAGAILMRGMTNPPETTSSAEGAAAPQLARWLDRALDVALGIIWWGVLLIPEYSRPYLLNQALPGKALAGLRVVGIVSVACLLFRLAHGRRPRLSALTALLCLWGGAAAFLLTGPWDLTPNELVHACVRYPLLFIASAWYVVLPMTALTAVVLARAERARRRGSTSPAAPHRAAP